jgi:hypothetical protein
MDDYNRDATWKIIGKGAAQLFMSEDAFVCTSCAHRAKVESDRAHMSFVRAAQNREWDKLMVRRPLEGVWCLQRIHPSRTALTACWSA